MYKVQASYTWYLFFIFPSFCLYYVTDLIRKLDYVNWFILFLIRIKFGHTQISVPKIGIPMSKTACINLRVYWKKGGLTYFPLLGGPPEKMGGGVGNQGVDFYTPWKHQKTTGFLMLLGGVERDYWHEMI